MKAYHKNTLPAIITVICVAIRLAHGQMYLLAFGQNHHSYYNGKSVFSQYSYSPADTSQNRSSSQDSYDSGELNHENNINSTINTYNSNNHSNVNPSILHENSSDQEMDLVTVVWYVATFMALATFFLLMTCPNRSNANNNSNNYNNNSRRGTVGPPLTPTPSYSEFAPPSYESVMSAKTNIFIIPHSGTIKTLNDSAHGNNNQSENIIPSTAVNFYIINEIGKF